MNAVHPADPSARAELLDDSERREQIALQATQRGGHREVEETGRTQLLDESRGIVRASSASWARALTSGASRRASASGPESELAADICFLLHRFESG